MSTFLQELSQHSLKSLPPLGGYLTSSQSQRPFTREKTGSSIGRYKPPSAPHQRLVSFMEDRDMTFDTEATMGSSNANTVTTLYPKKGGSRTQTKILRSRGVDVQTIDYLDMEV